MQASACPACTVVKFHYSIGEYSWFCAKQNVISFVQINMVLVWHLAKMPRNLPQLSYLPSAASFLSVLEHIEKVHADFMSCLCWKAHAEGRAGSLPSIIDEADLSLNK